MTTFGSVYSGPELDMDQVRTFLRVLHGAGDGAGNVVFTWWGRKAKPAESISSRTWMIEDGTGALSRMVASEQNLFVSVCRFAEESRRERDAQWVPGLWADIDVKPESPRALHSAEELQRVMQALPTPTMVVDTGSGGIHPYWLFTRAAVGEDVSRVGRLMPAWIVHLSTIASQAVGREIKFDSVGDLARVLRVPGTVRWKSLDMPTASTIREVNENIRYNLEDLEAWVPESAFQKVDRESSARTYDRSKSDDQWIEGARTGELNGSVGQHDHLIRAIASKLSRGGTESEAVAFGMEVASTYPLEDPRWPWDLEDVEKIVRSSLHFQRPPLTEVSGQAAAWVESLTTPFFPDEVVATNGNGNGAAPAEAEPVVEAPVVVAEPSVRPYPHRASGEWPRRTWDIIGMAQRMGDHFGEKIRWIEKAGSWVVYIDGRWIFDDMGSIERLTHELLDRLPDTEALSYADTKKDSEKLSPREAFLKWATSMRTSSGIEGTKSRLKGYASARITDFDRDPWLLGVRNGVVNLKTGELLGHRPDLLLMQQAPTPYAPEAECPRWMKFLERVLPDPSMREYLQRMVGYSLTGDTGEQKLFLHIGAGANGKSVFLNVISRVLGDYAQAVPGDTLIMKTGEKGVPTDIARMVGKRFLQLSETAAGKRLDETVVKGLTGGDTMSARFMRQDFFEFTPVGKIHYVTNHPPRISDSPSIWRRLVRIDWNVVIPPEERDANLSDRIVEEEAAGVLAWAMAGCHRWRNEGLEAPVAAKISVDEYRQSQDVFGEFVEEALTLDVETESTVGELYAAYSMWSAAAGTHAMTKQAFSEKMSERGYEKFRTNKARGFRGVRPTSSLLTGSGM